MIKIAIVVVAATVLAAVQFDYFQVQRDNLAVSRLRENEVAGYAPAALAPYAGGPVILGIRPEDLYEEPTGPMGGKREAMRVRVQTVEPLGAETLLMLTGGSGEELTARIGRETALRPGAEADLFLDTAEIHLFDPKTTKAIPRTL